MNVKGTKNGIQTILSQASSTPVKEVPVPQKRARIVDIRDLQISDEVENLVLQVARYHNENMDLQEQLKNDKKKNQERYNRMLLYWKMLYEVTPETAKPAAKEFGVDLKRREFGYALEDFDAIFKAVCKSMFANDISIHDVNQTIERAQKQAEDAQIRREYAERELVREKAEKENFIRLFEAEKMKKTDQIFVRIGSFSAPAEQKQEIEVPHVELNLQNELEQELQEQMPSIFDEVDEVLPNKLEELAEDDLVASLLKEKGCAVHASDNPKHNYVVEIDNKKVPLRYFDYALMDNKVFEEIMEDTNEIYLVFDNKENYSKGNSQWTRWLLFSSRKPHIRFSMTTVDDLRQKGLNKII